MGKETKGKSRDSRFTYLVDESAISQRVGFDVEYPIRVFTLEGLGIDPDRFLRELAPTFSLIGVDEYLMKLTQVNFLKECFPHASVMLDNFLLYYYANQTTLEDVYEPFLLLKGFLQRTPRGRVVTQRAYEHLGIPVQLSSDQMKLF